MHAGRRGARGAGGGRYRRRPDPQPLTEILPSVLRELKPKNRGHLDEFREIWEAVVGSESARRARIVSFTNGTLVVEVASAAVKHHLATFRASWILQELRRQVPGAGLKTIRYRVGS